MQRRTFTRARSDPKNKIDGAIALIMALGRHMVVKDESNLDNFINNMIMVI